MLDRAELMRRTTPRGVSSTLIDSLTLTDAERHAISAKVWVGLSDSAVRQRWRMNGGVNLQPNGRLAVQREPPAVGKPVDEQETEVPVPRDLDALGIESKVLAAVSHDDAQSILIPLKA